MQKRDNNTKNDTKDVKNIEMIEKELHKRIQNALISKNSRKNTYLGEVSQKISNTVKKILGIDITGRKHIISDNDIRHIMKQHGNAELEKQFITAKAAKCCLKVL